MKKTCPVDKAHASHTPRNGKEHFCGECGSELEKQLSTLDRAKVIANDAKNLAQYVGKSTAQAAFRAVTYPVAGNFLACVQEGIQDKVGKAWYNASQATQTSCFTNLVTYPVLASQVLGPEDWWDLAFMAGLTLVAGVAIGSKTDEMGLSPRIDGHRAQGTILGSIASLPILGGMKLYDKAKNYAKSVEERA